VCSIHIFYNPLIMQVIVVNNIVYDCTKFIKEHPGGEQIIRAFGGAECTWQFWRFHRKNEMEEFGRPLRVGRTTGMVNKFKEPSKYVGLRRLGHDDW
jgi:cytochrome b involved in lipid metabolism